jgi:DnaJ-class molecular chaperone
MNDNDHDSILLYNLELLNRAGVSFAAHEILSDEEKRKNYDLYGDEKGNPGIGDGHFGNHEGFTGGGPKTTYFKSGDGWQTMGGPGNGKTFSFSFGGNPGSDGGNPFGFDLGDVFSNMFGGGGGSMGGNQHGGFAGSAGPGRCKNFQPAYKPCHH